MPERKLKLYVWEDVFADYYPGMAMALARDVREARRLIAQKYPSPASAMRELAGQPQVIRLDEQTAPQAWYVCGGG